MFTTDHTILQPENAGAALRLSQPVVLVGLMGAGKSTVGRRLARELGIGFIDSDDEISAAAGCTIADIFEIYGEAIFRDLEKRVLLRLLGGGPSVIATGGGAWMQQDIRQAVEERAVSVWLEAGLEVILERVSRKNTRPLLQQGDKRAILSRLIAERHPVYALARLRVDSGSGTHETIAERVIAALKELDARGK
jgi:shikimate kinase